MQVIAEVGQRWNDIIIHHMTKANIGIYETRLASSNRNGEPFCVRDVQGMN